MIIDFRRLFLMIISSAFIFFLNDATAQKSSSDFIGYLYQSSQYKHLADYLIHLKAKDQLPIDGDSANFLIGKSYYHLQEHRYSNAYLNSVEKPSSPFIESQFLININAIYMNDFSTGVTVLNELKTTDSLISDLKLFELSGLSLLNRDLNSYIKYDSTISRDYYYFSSQRQSLANVAESIEEKKEKSPLVAGILTAVVPGAGKFYAGKKGQGIYSFVISTFLALQLWESYRKDGIESPRFVIYGGLFSLFHIGNVWSSALTVKNYNNEYREAVNYRIKMDMHIPVRSIFN